MTTPNTNALTTSVATEFVAIDPAARLGYVHCTVADLQRQIAFYRDILGFQVHWQHNQQQNPSAGLGAGGPDLLRLTQVEGAQHVDGTTGLYHTAFLVPQRRDLAHLLKRIAERRTPIQGMTDHGTHWAIYLPDAENNGVELAWDFPLDQWPKSFAEMMSRNRALDPRSVFEVLQTDLSPWIGLPAETSVGHVHLHVADLAATRRFYHDLLGFGIPFDFGRGNALFFAAGSYHHHVGTNLWHGANAPRPPANATGLREYTVLVPDSAELVRLAHVLRANGEQAYPLDKSPQNGFRTADPAGNGIILTTRSGQDQQIQ